MKKKTLLALFCTVGLMGSLGFNLGTEAKELNKFIKNEAGELGYDLNQKVPMYPGSNEIVDIPENYTPDKELFQSSWVATIQNLNFSQPGSQEEFQTNYLNVLGDFKEWNMNAMIFQVRPLLDSWYQSEFNPWSEFLTGTQGVNPGYDPLPWMIEETHKAGMEYHAWLNPYRVSNTKFNNAGLQNKTGKTESELAALAIPDLIKLYNQAGILADNNYAVLHPEQVLMFDQKLFLNPGIPEVREHVFNTVDELVRKYDIDAIHFDDYFYPYRITVDGENVFFGTKDEDKATFEKYGAGFTSIEEWRRHNINLLAEGVKATIDTANNELGKSVQFGISPFGIWEHIENDERGSHTPLTSSQSYSGSIFADTYKWIKEETVDYMAPQIYWSFDQAAAPYGDLTKWWNDVAEGTHTQIYIGHANYKHVGNGGWDASWLNPEEVPNQLKFNTAYPNIKGSALFSYNDITPSNIDSLADNLKQRHQAKNQSIELLKKDYFNQKLLVPAKPWLSHGEVLPPKDVAVNGKEVSITASENGRERFYIVYVGEGNEAEVTSNGANIVERIYNDGSGQFKLTLPELVKGNVFVTAIDAAGVESKPFIKEVPVEKGKVTIKYLEQGTNKVLDEMTLEGDVDAAFNIEVKQFATYEIIKPEFSLEGKFTTEEQQFSIFYKKVETTETSTTESSSSEKGEGSGSSNSGSSNSGKGSSSSKVYAPVKNLPKTGEKQRNIIYVVFGLMILSIAGIIFKKKSTR